MALGSVLPRAAGMPCDPANPHACDSGFCINAVCCDTDICFEPDRCDIFGSEGSCASPLLQGDPCNRNTDCEDPLTCAFEPVSDRFECSAPPPPTPTLIPFTPQPTVPPPTVIVCLGASSCVGDCNGNAQVTVDELLTMVNVALGVADVASCGAGDANCDQQITVNEILTAVNDALDECAGSLPPPTATPTISVAPNPIYVRNNGSDGNSGADSANALRSITQAAQVARNGDVIIVGPGTYHEGVTTSRPGVAAQGLSFVANVAGDLTGDSAGEVRIDGTGIAAAAGFNLSRAPGSSIDGFTITGFADAGIVIKSGSDNLTVQNCIVFNNPGGGIRVQDSASVVIFNNLVYGNGGTGISIVGQISGSPDAQVLSNTIANNGVRGITFGNTIAASPRALVHNNVVQGNMGDANIKVFTSPSSDLGYDGNYNLVYPPTYIPSGGRGSNDIDGDALFTADFHLQTTSPAVDGGGPLNLSSAQTTLLRARTTTGTNLDTNALDLGFHFRPGM